MNRVVEITSYKLVEILNKYSKEQVILIRNNILESIMDKDYNVFIQINVSDTAKESI